MILYKGTQARKSESRQIYTFLIHENENILTKLPSRARPAIRRYEYKRQVFMVLICERKNLFQIDFYVLGGGAAE
jgi:hypothetical protein